MVIYFSIASLVVGLAGKWDYWENLTLNKLFDLVKYTKKNIFHCDLKQNVHAALKCFVIFSFSLKFLFTHITSHCPKCIFQMNNHKDPAG